MAINEVTSIDVKTLPPFKRLIMTIGELPTSYLESMTYAELLMWFCNFLQEKVLPTINNNADALQEVITYLENLDLQDEVNNKLDEMVEQGTLQEIIAEYLNANALWCFDNVAEMKLATNFIDGSYARTLGYYDINDGGASLYKIREITNSDTVDEATIIALYDNTLIAELVTDKNLNIVQVGGKNDGTSIVTALQNASKTDADTIYFPEGTYLIDNTVTLTKNLTGNKATININRTNNDEFGIYYTANNKKIENLKFHTISSNKLFKIYESNNLVISNCKFTTATSGRTEGGLVDLYTTNNNILIENCYFETHATTTGGIWVREGTTSGLTKNVCFNNCEFIGDTADETIGIWGWKGTVNNVSVNNSIITRPTHDGISNPHIISLGSEGITKNCGLNNCELNIYQATNSIFHTSYTNDTNLYVKNCIINTHMQSLNNSLVAIISTDSEGLLIDNCTFNLLNTTLNPDVGSSLLAKYKNTTFNCETQINLNIANLENCIVNNKATSQVAGKCARSLFAKNCIFNNINRTGSSFVQTLSTNDKVNIENTVLYYATGATPQTYFIFSDGTAYNTTAPLIIKNTMFKGSLYLNSSNISNGYVIGNYTNQASLGTVSANLINKNNEVSVNY